MRASKKQEAKGEPPTPEQLGKAQEAMVKDQGEQLAAIRAEMQKRFAAFDATIANLQNQLKANNQALEGMAAKLTALRNPPRVRPSKGKLARQSIDVPFVDDEDDVMGVG